MNTLLEKSSRMPSHTSLRTVFAALGGRQREFDWPITNLDCTPYLDEFRHARVNWLSGDQLTGIVGRHEIQFVWAVLSAGFRTDAVDRTSLAVEPYADGNSRLWLPGVAIQHPRAVVEIVCWDSSATLLLSTDDDLALLFRSYFPEAVDLDEYSRSRQRRATTRGLT